MALKNFAFNVLNTDKFARRGLIETHRGNIHTSHCQGLHYRRHQENWLSNNFIKYISFND